MTTSTRGATRVPAVLVLEDGRIFRGRAYGAVGVTFGEAVFSTGMTGYQETLTDPSYHRQVVVMTAPQIGNVGVNPEDEEAQRPHVAGFVMRESSPLSSNWRANRALPQYLEEHGVVAIAEIDTRALTRRLRTQGALRGGVSTEVRDPRELVEKVRRSPGLEGRDLVREVTCQAPYTWIGEPACARECPAAPSTRTATKTAPWATCDLMISLLTADPRPFYTAASSYTATAICSPGPGSDGVRSRRRHRTVTHRHGSSLPTPGRFLPRRSWHR